MVRLNSRDIRSEIRKVNFFTSSRIGSGRINENLKQKKYFIFQKSYLYFFAE